MQHNNFEQEAMIVDSVPAPRASRQSGRAYPDVGAAWVSIKTFIVTVLIVFLSIVLALGVWTVRGYLPIVGIIGVSGACILIICGVAWAVISTVRHATRADFYPVEESGAYLRDSLGRVRPLAPMIAAPARVNTKTAKVEIVPEVPSIFDLIESGDIAPGSLEMVMGYDKAQLQKGILQLVIGPWPGTHAIAGRGRSGKTRRVIAEVVQALVAGAQVTICDPHYTKQDSLARALEPLEKFLIIARGEEAIVTASQDFYNEMEARVDDQGRECKPRLIVYDEWSRLMDENNPKMPEGGRDLLIDVAKNCSTQYAGYMGFCCLIGQVWTEDAAGGTIVRRSLQSIFVHQLSAEYAAFFFKPAKWRNLAEELKRRECIFRDIDNQVRVVITEGVPDDTAQRAAGYLTSIGIQMIEAPASASMPPLPYREPRRLPEQQAIYQVPMIPAPGQSWAGEIHTDELILRSRESFTHESENDVKAPYTPGESIPDFHAQGESASLQGETFTVTPAQDNEATPYTREQETAILKTAFQVAKEGGKVTREAIKTRLGWNNKMHPIVKAVCDKHGIAS